MIGLRAAVEHIATTDAAMDYVLPLYRAIREDPGLAPSVAAFNARLREIVAAWAAGRLGCDPGDLEPQLFAETAVAVRETVLRLWSVSPAETGVGALTDAAFHHRPDVGDEQLPARAQHSHGLVDRAIAPLGRRDVVDRHRALHDVEGVVRERQGSHVGRAHVHAVGAAGRGGVRERGLGAVAALVLGPQVHADCASRRQPPGCRDQRRDRSPDPAAARHPSSRLGPVPAPRHASCRAAWCVGTRPWCTAAPHGRPPSRSGPVATGRRRRRRPPRRRRDRRDGWCVDPVLRLPERSGAPGGAVLGERPDASMEDIATAAGVTRQTVYVRFPHATP